MGLDNPSSGYGNGIEFSTSAIPWVTSSTAPAAGSPVRFDFSKISRYITISNRDTTATNTLSIAFTRNGATGSNKYVVKGGEVVTFEVRVKSVWIQGESSTPAFSLLAGLTTIDSRHMPELTGSSWNGVG